MEKPGILLLENISPRAAELLSAEGYAVERMQTALPEPDLLSRLKGVDVLGVRVGTKITRKLLEASDLKAVGTFTAGFDHIDLQAAAEKNIPVFHAPADNALSVVELVLGQIIMLARRIPEKTEDLKRGIWNRSAKNCHEIRGKTLGIVGYGLIGSMLSQSAEALGMSVVYFDVFDKPPVGKARKCSTLDELLGEADFVSLHVFGGPQTVDMISEKQFNLMKGGAILINASRGTVVNEQALIRALESGKIAGASLDVFTTEPPGQEAKFQSPLAKFPNVILTPHIGGSTEEALERIAMTVAGKIIRFLKTGDRSTDLTKNVK